MILAAGNVAPHPPADPQQQDTARQGQADNSQQLHGNGRHSDPQAHRCDQAPENDLPAHLRRHAGGGQADHHGIVAGQHNVDHQHLRERNQAAGLQQCQFQGHSFGKRWV